jgi:hypothetical protein
MRRQEQQSGFGTTGILLTVLVVVLLAASGVVVYQHHKSSSTSAKSTAATGSTQATGQSASQTGVQFAPAVTQYLTIKEWGVKLPLSDSIKSAYYVVGTGFSSDPDGRPSGVFLGLTSLSDSSCNPSNNNNGGTGAIGVLLRVPPAATDAVSGQPLTQKYPNGTTIGNYYYAYQSWVNRTSCNQKSTAQAADSAFAAAAKNIVAATY